MDTRWHTKAGWALCGLAAFTVWLFAAITKAVNLSFLHAADGAAPGLMIFLWLGGSLCLIASAIGVAFRIHSRDTDRNG
jgi:hypothetical protein